MGVEGTIGVPLTDLGLRDTLTNHLCSYFTTVTYQGV